MMEKTEEIFQEKLVDNPMSIINKNVKTKFTKSEATITIANNVTKINLKKYGIEPQHIFPKVAFGNMITFQVIHHKLHAMVGVTIAPAGGYLGDICIAYTFKDNMYQADTIRFIPA